MKTDDEDLQFSWDPAKASSNLAKHGIAFPDATYVFDDPARLEESDDFSQGEYRSRCIGTVGNLVLTVVFSEPEENLIRLISARLATASERTAYERHRFHP